MERKVVGSLAAIVLLLSSVYYVLISLDYGWFAFVPLWNVTEWYKYIGYVCVILSSTCSYLIYKWRYVW